MNQAWTPEQLQRIGDSRELEIASRRPDGVLRAWLPIWVVCAGDDAYVRTWHRRTTGWFGHVVRDGAARVRVPGLEIDAAVEDIGANAGDDVRSAIDVAYRAKYGLDGAVAQMISESAALTTLRVTPSQ